MSPTPTPDATHLEERLSQYREMHAQFEMVRDRLRRAEEERNSVPRRVYDKVRAEYDRQLDALRARMTPLRDEIDGYRQQFEDRLKDASGTLETIEEELSEVTFRHRIGEFNDDDAAARRREIEARLAAAQSRIDGVRETLTAMRATGVPDADAMAEEVPPAARPMLHTTPAPEPTRPVETESSPVAAKPAAVAPEPNVTPAAPAEDATARRPVLRPTRAGESRGGFENPHDWIDEFGRDSKRAPQAGVPAKPVAPPAPIAPAPQPVTPSSAPSLVFVSGPHAGQSIPLLATTLTIGREHDNNIEIKDADVARYHARILNMGGEYVVEDMSSTTGTWVNGERTPRAPLGHGDVIRIGQTEIAVDFEWASNSLERAGIDPAA